MRRLIAASSVVLVAVAAALLLLVVVGIVAEWNGIVKEAGFVRALGDALLRIVTGTGAAAAVALPAFATRNRRGLLHAGYRLVPALVLTAVPAATAIGCGVLFAWALLAMPADGQAGIVLLYPVAVSLFCGLFLLAILGRVPPSAKPGEEPRASA